MLRFTIRDVLWLTVVAGLAVGWGVDRYGYRHSFQSYNLKYLLDCEGWTFTENDDGSVVVWKPGERRYGFGPLGNPNNIHERPIYFDSQGKLLAPPDKK